MSSPKPHLKRPTWFQDVKTGCEKQADYFLKIRKLQKELINREQHNLVNAMERLKQLQYPRRRPVIRNFPSQQVLATTSGFPKRPLNAREDLKRQRQRTGNELIKAVKGKHLLTTRDCNEEENISISFEDIKRIYSRMLPVLNDNQIANIVHEVRGTFPNEPSTYLLQPHLPSIPNVKRKTNARLENRLKLLTLANESEYVTTIPKTTTPIPRRKESLTASPAFCNTKISVKKSECKKMLNFDVDPNDLSVFTHNKNDDDDDNDENDDDVIDSKDDGTGPLPPPNSRPGSNMANIKLTLDNKCHVKVPSVGLEDEHQHENSPKPPDSATEEVDSNHQASDLELIQDQSKDIGVTVTEESELLDGYIEDVIIQEPKVIVSEISTETD